MAPQRNHHRPGREGAEFDRDRPRDESRRGRCTVNTDDSIRPQFSPDVVAAVMRHMNLDHADDCLLICRNQGLLSDATSAAMSGMDCHGIEFTAIVDSASVQVRVPWSHPLTERAEVRPEVTRMYYEACQALGVPARPPAAH